MNGHLGWGFGLLWLAVVLFLVRDQYLEMVAEDQVRKDTMDKAKVERCGLCHRKGGLHSPDCPAHPKNQPGRRVPSREPKKP